MSDAVSIFGAFLISYWIRFFSPLTEIIPVTKGIPDINGYIEFSLIVIPIWIIIFQTRKMYRLKRSVFIFDEFFIIIKCISIGVLIAMGLVFVLKGDFPYSRLVFFLIWLFSIIIVTIGRYFLLKIEKNLYNSNKGVNNVAILGTNLMAKKIYENFSRDKFTGYNITGYFSYGENSTGEMENKIHHGDYTLIPDMLQKLNLDKIFISIQDLRRD